MTMRDKPYAITLDPGSSLANKTGSWRSQRPVYADHLPPCNAQCPAGEDIQGWLYEAEAGRYEAAWRRLVRDNPLPAVMGRVCYHSCEAACNRGRLDQAVGINAVERFLGDEALARGWAFDPPAADTGRQVLVVGAGPSGLSAAYQLRRLGHAVTLVDAEPQAGGMMRYGIPRYRLPREVLDAEIRRITALGVRLQLARRIDDLAAAMAAGPEGDGQRPFDAAFLAVGAHLAKRAWIPAKDSARILDAVQLLHAVEDGAAPPQLGRRVVVYGGGNTALDVARTARRLGATEAVIVYRRTRERMPAHPAELAEALAEGVQMKWLSTVTQVDAGPGAASADPQAPAATLTIEKMRLDEHGVPQPTGEHETLQADALVLALGQDVDLGLLQRLPGLVVKDGVVQVDPATMMTGCPGVFAGGDMVPAERNVTVAVGHGKKAARQIDAWLRGAAAAAPRHAPAPFERLNTWYYSDAPATVRPQLDAARRTDGFAEVQGGLTEDNALYEARRCLSCGNCFECDNCYGVCPDNAVIKLGPGQRYQIALDYCKGCGLCAAECPCGAIEMVAEAG